MALTKTELSSMDKAAKVVDDISGFVWNNILLFVLLGAGLYFTVRQVLFRFVILAELGTEYSVISHSVALRQVKMV